jgi:hypothetical protein
VPSDRLHRGANASACDAKNERPAILRVKVRIGDDEQSRIGVRDEIVFYNGFEDVGREDLFPIRVDPGSGLDQAVCLQILQIKFSWGVIIHFTRDTREECLNLRFEQNDKLRVKWVALETAIRPHLKQLNFLDAWNSFFGLNLRS